MLFERLLNLDVELGCLATKAFVAKEQFVNDVFYSHPRKKNDEKSESDKKDKVSELLEEIHEAKAEGKDTAELEAELKTAMGEFLASDKKEEAAPPITKEDISELLAEIQQAKEAGEDTTKLEAELKEATEKFLAVPVALKTPDIVAPSTTGRAAKRRVEQPSSGGNAVKRKETPQTTTPVTPPQTTATPVTPPVQPQVTVDGGVTMDYSGAIQPGVTYEPSKSVNPMLDAINPPSQESVK